MNFFKGTGISGLRGIEPKHDKIIRPLLFASKHDIIEYANDQRLQWVNDSSNDETKYTRNFFRHEIIPAIEKVYPDVKKNLAANIERSTEAELLYRQAIEAHKKKLLEYKGSEVHIPVLKLAKIEPLKSIVYEIIKNYGFSSNQVDEVVKLLSSESGKYMVSASHRILRNRAWLIISPMQQEEQTITLIEEGSEKIAFDNKQLSVKCSDNIIVPADKNIALLDAKEIKFPLLLRRWKQGDYFYPLGMNKKKKLARFFIDQKLSMNDKENIWVIESSKKILWIVGQRIDDRFKITGNTKKVLRLSLHELLLLCISIITN
jgi:tRNA(Ile)-lysidine synthase